MDSFLKNRFGARENKAGHLYHADRLYELYADGLIQASFLYSIFAKLAKVLV